jgi:hypothetical protein
MNRTRYIFAILLLAVSVTTLPAQDNIEIRTPERIARMIESMPMKDIPLQGVFRCPELSNTVMFYTEARDGVTEQLGARLFPDEIRSNTLYDPVIIGFIERLWVELLLRKTTESQISLLKEYGVRIVLGGYPLGSGNFSRLSQALDVINSMNSFSTNIGGTELDVQIRTATGNTLHIYIPASRDLLFQYDKKEHEERLVKELFNSRKPYRQVDRVINMLPYDDNIWVSGGLCYMIDSLRNDVFLTRSGQAVWDSKSYPVETMRNILMSAVVPVRLNGMTLEITPHTYNRDIPKFRIPMSQFLGYIQNQGFEFYTGDAGRNGDRYQCLLVMYNTIYNYLHMLSVSFTPDQLDAGQTVIKADLSTFIPQHNIKNLFQEK